MISQKEYTSNNHNNVSNDKSLQTIFNDINQQLSTINQLNDQIKRVKIDFIYNHPASLCSHLKEVQKNLQIQAISQYYDPKVIPVQNDMLFKIMNDAKRKKIQISDLISSTETIWKNIDISENLLTCKKIQIDQQMNTKKQQLNNKFVEFETEKKSIETSEQYLKEIQYQQYLNRIQEIENKKIKTNEQIKNHSSKQSELEEKKRNLQIQISDILLQEQNLEILIKVICFQNTIQLFS